MFCHNFVVLSISIYLLTLPSTAATALPSSDDNVFQQVRRQREESRQNPRGAHSSVKITSLEFNDGIHLAIGPRCGVISASAWAGEMNTGIDWEKINTVVAFGDSLTQVGNNGDGSPPSSISFIGTNPSAGGRSTNGETWIEQLLHFAEDPMHPRRLISYARTGAVTDKEIWRSRYDSDDSPSQLSRFYANNTVLNMNPDTTLYAGYLGLNDFWAMPDDGYRMSEAGHRAARHVRDLHEYAGATNILWLGVQLSITYTEEYRLAVWSGLRDLHESTHGAHKVNFVYADMERFWTAVLEDETYANFGYTSNQQCLESDQSSIEDECEDPARTVCYMGREPSKQTHFIMAEYIYNILDDA